MEKLYADIVLRLAVPRTFQFSVPAALRERIQPGQRVRVPLRSRSDVGYVAALSDTPKVSGIRPILTILDEEPLIAPDLLSLLLWVAEENLASPGLVFKAALPRAVHFQKTGRATAKERLMKVFHAGLPPEELPAVAASLEGRAPAQARFLRALADGPRLKAQLPPLPSASLKSLLGKGWVHIEEKALKRGVVKPTGGERKRVVLSPSQSEAFERIRPSIGRRTYEPFLLHGVTGSGKTEIYLRALEHLPEGRQAIILVPEVTLTIQFIEHIRSRLPCDLAVWHHQLSDGEKFDLWQLLRRGEVPVVIGARSAVFAPLPDVGLIVIDEEQESSFKQDESPSYHARDVALERARRSGATVLLGSATPSLESYYLAGEGSYTLIDLLERYGGTPLPNVEMIDLREAPKEQKRDLIAAPLVAAAAEVVERGRQVLFFLNRRGYAPFTQCGECGKALKCPNCQVSLVFHRPENLLLCHYCDYRIPPPDTCPTCRSARIRQSGTGTQRLEEEVVRLFPGKTVARLDRDSTARKGEGARLVMDFAEGKVDILVGTQMAAKGLHFPLLDLVGVLAPDATLNLPDFRAAERTFHVVTQVAGRAGREGTVGRVIIQTHQPEHYALKAASRHDYHSFYEQELEFRRELGYPPFCDLLLFRCSGPVEDRLDETAGLLADRIREILQKEVPAERWRLFGPVPAPLKKIRNRYRYHLLIKAKVFAQVAAPLREHFEALGRLAGKSNVRFSIDVNPASLM